MLQLLVSRDRDAEAIVDDPIVDSKAALASKPVEVSALIDEAAKASSI